MCGGREHGGPHTVEDQCYYGKGDDAAATYVALLSTLTLTNDTGY